MWNWCSSTFIVCKGAAVVCSMLENHNKRVGGSQMCTTHTIIRYNDQVCFIKQPINTTLIVYCTIAPCRIYAWPVHYDWSNIEWEELETACVIPVTYHMYMYSHKTVFTVCSNSTTIGAGPGLSTFRSRPELWSTLCATVWPCEPLVPLLYRLSSENGVVLKPNCHIWPWRVLKASCWKCSL